MTITSPGEVVAGASWAELQSPLYWDDGAVVMLDQRLLPGQEVWRRYRDDAEVAAAIRDMVIRGAPAIGCAAAMGLAAGARQMPDEPAAFERAFARACSGMAESRPTAVNLFWAIDRQKAVFARALAGAGGVQAARAALEREALAIWREDVDFCRAIGRFGAELVKDGAHVLTHCNAGALATGGYGTALGVVRGAVEAGKRIAVYADETRPYLQGARLTAWELSREGIDVTLICDNMAGALMAKGEISCVVVGADRVAHNGDAANKIGTYSLAVLARHHEIPFYVAAPRSTIDRAIETGADIPIEQRAAREVTHVGETAIAPEGIKVAYPAFDVTPAALIDAFICEVGVARPPSRAAIDALFEDA
ncbi:MAG: S-methyl-5-thioribose-1-phosphate isomerase [Myxococcales bacterium]|nr:S-methyl-5-thioribose-1-phosphate isomerase [Myxococcales bacterium]